MARCEGCPVPAAVACASASHPRYCELNGMAPGRWRDIIVANSLAPPAVDGGAEDGPGFWGKAAGFAAAAISHVAAGCPTVSDEEKARRLAICGACENFDAEHGSCRICGCAMKLKASWALEKCPDTPPRWTAVTAGPSAP
jgi:hypothetical protein